MKIGLSFRNELGSIAGGQWIIEQFDQLIARISGVWRVEHKDNGQHGDVIADSVTTTDLTVNDTFTATTLRASGSTVVLGGALPSQPGVHLRQVADELYVYENDGTSRAVVNAYQGKFLNNSGTGTGASVTTGTLDISNATGAGQIKFPATQNASADANTLDDYGEGSFTGTLTGVSGTVQVTVTYTKIGNQVTVNVPTLTGTSNATTKTLTGMPVAIRPAAAKNIVLAVSDNGGAFVPSFVQLTSAGVFVFYADITTATNWTASGTAEIAACQMTYTLA